MKRPGDDHFIGAILNETYEVQGLLGKGGMGAVYEGVNVRLGRRVAIKFLSNLANHDPEVFHRFRREAKLATELAHPHIIDVIDFNETGDGVPYMVMEQLSGEDLDAAIRRAGGLAAQRVAFIIRQVCSALHAAHTRSVVHRDLKPANIFLCDNKAFADFAVVLDFGISKVLGSSSLKTTDDLVIGTPHYMAPEQVDRSRGKVGPATDIFALGAIMYQMLSGALPFQADSAPALLYALIHKEPEPLGTLRPEHPAALIAVVERALAKAPGDRFPSVVELSSALRDVVPGAAPVGREWEREASRQSAHRAASLAATVPPSGADHLGATVHQDALDTTLPSGQAEAPRAGPPSTLTSAAAQKVAGGVSRSSRVPLVIAVTLVAGVALAVGLVFGFDPTDDAQEPHAVAVEAGVTTAGLTATGAAARRPDARRPDAQIPADTRASEVRDASLGTGRVSITLRGPRGARIVDPTTGQTLARVPGQLVLQRGAAPLRLRTQAPDHLPGWLTLVPDRDRSITVTLRRRPARTPAAKPAQDTTKDDLPPFKKRLKE